MDGTESGFLQSRIKGASDPCNPCLHRESQGLFPLNIASTSRAMSDGFTTDPKVIQNPLCLKPGCHLFATFLCPHKAHDMSSGGSKRVGTIPALLETQTKTVQAKPLPPQNDQSLDRFPGLNPFCQNTGPDKTRSLLLPPLSSVCSPFVGHSKKGTNPSSFLGPHTMIQAKRLKDRFSKGFGKIKVSKTV
jgi:hypothetical protein